jgi:hypothetical protein
MGFSFGVARIPKSAIADNATASVTTETPKNGQSVYVIAVYYAFTTALAGAKNATISDGTNTLNHQVFNTQNAEPCIPFQMKPNSAVTASLPASGAGGNKGSVTLVYYIG